MKIAILILCHKNPEQVNLFIETMRHPQFVFFVHVDQKSDIEKRILHCDDVIVLPNQNRIDTRWARISMVDAALSLFRFATKYDSFEFFWLCSGQDFPIKPVSEILKWFELHPDNDFVELYKSKNAGLFSENHYDKRNAIFFPQWMLGNSMLKRIIKRAYNDITGGYNHTFNWARRKNTTGMVFYFGSEWICLTKRTLDWMLNFLEIHSEYYSYMKNCNCSDESFFQTLLMNSPYADYRMDYLHYIDWSEGKNSPKILEIGDVDYIAQSGKLMTRKIDLDTDSDLVGVLKSKMIKHS